MNTAYFLSFYEHPKMTVQVRSKYRANFDKTKMHQVVVVEESSDGLVDMLQMERLDTRVSPIQRYDAQIKADGGDWDEIECGEGAQVLIVIADDATLSQIAADSAFLTFPQKIDQLLIDLDGTQADSVVSFLRAMGYEDSEIKAQLGQDLKTRTLRDVLTFAMSFRVQVAYDGDANAIIYTGEMLPPAKAFSQLEAKDTRAKV